jgi:CubicO group peptidase (beta-lactamase class C family)
MPRHARTCLAFLSVLLVATLAPGQPATTPGPPPDLDAWVARAMAAFDVPGIAVGIVKDGKVVVAKGYGVRTLGEPGPVDERTLFGIASNTKAFTATALGILVDEEKVSWDDPVTKHLPAFAVHDPWVTRELIVRDTLSHRSGLGLGAGDLLFWPDTDRTREDVLRQSRFIRPASSLRSRYAYNNLMFVVAGEVVRAAGGVSYDEFVRSRIFGPLGMGDTRFGNDGLPRDANLASPHSKGWRVDGPLTPVPYTQDRTWAAAAGIRSNVVDLSKWVLAQLAKGQGPAGARLWSETVANELWSVHTPQRPSEPPPALRASRANFAGYGLGFGLRDVAGRKVVSHGGALVGMVTTIAMVPDERLGVIVLTNQEEGGAFSSIVHHVFDHYFGRSPTDWIAAFREQRTEMLRKAWEAEAQAARDRRADSRPSLPLDAYAGDYEDAWYGKVTIAKEGERLVLRMTHSPTLVAELGHWQHDTFRAVFREKTTPDAYVTFALDHAGRIARVSMVPCSSLADFSFDYQDLDLRPVPAAAAEGRAPVR